MTQIDPAHAAQVLHDVLASLGGTADTTGKIDTNSRATPAPTATSTGTGGTGGGGGGHEVGNRDQDGFYTALLTKLGMPVNDANMRFMRAWNQGEGMDAGHYNPFATTQGGYGGSDLNSVGVKSYGSLEQGVDATAATLQNGQYGGILSGLAASDPIAAAQGVANSPWGTGGLVLQILGGGG